MMKEVKILKTLKIYSDNPRTLNTLVKDEVREFQKDFADQLLELGYAKENKVDDELESLKEEAKELKIKGAHLMKSKETLIKAIADKKLENTEKEANEQAEIARKELEAKELEAKKKALPKLENKAITNLDNK